MKKYVIFLTTIMIALAAGAFAQQSILNIPALHQLVDESESENKLQVQARNGQVLTTANEQANLAVLEKIKITYKSLQQRFNQLGIAINAADIGIYAMPTVSKIIRNQALVVQLAQKNPALIAISYESAIQFATNAKSLLAYVTGLTLCIGDLNQMKASDRKVLFDYIISELNRVQGLSANMLAMMQYSSTASLIKAANPFGGFIDADKSIGQKIIQNAKYLK